MREQISTMGDRGLASPFETRQVMALISSAARRTGESVLAAGNESSRSIVSSAGT